ncbi:MAG: hypothetical protein BZY79_06650 [SAR202 cluster bacterium Casp-Chloro-G4]|nr:hypothetical protein [Chloroflexota bacterium]PKB60898.1 MAG: hypothetical protein BZY79_06650 [SAR202 cluster bacterium Casp-Chloro-G4]
MLTFIRVLFLGLVAATFLTNLGWRKRLVILAFSGLGLIVGSIIVISLTSNTSKEPTLPTSPTAIVVVSPAPTREPEEPSFESACRLFRLVVQDIESDQLGAFDERNRRFNEIRANAKFPGSPASFLDLINTYAAAVDKKLGVDGAAEPPIFTETDVIVLDRAIRRSRDDMLSECRAREG